MILFCFNQPWGLSALRLAVLFPQTRSLVSILHSLLFILSFSTCQIMALDNNPLLFSLQILSVLNFSSTLRNVVRAVRGPIAQLSM